MLEMVELKDMQTRRPSQLSGGQQQRVALARALVFEPDLVLMDEPLGALDLKLREQMQLEIKHIHDALGMTTIYVTHDQGEALTMSDRVAVFDAGVIQQIDEPSNVYESPANSFVANFIGENNRLNGSIESVDDRTSTILLDTGHRVIAKRSAFEIGARTTLSIRPERLTLVTDGRDCGNRFEATVTELIYFGSHTKVRMSLAGSHDFTATLPIAAAKVADLEVGETIEIGWEPEHCLVLDPI